MLPRDAPELARTVVLELEGPNVELSTIDAPTLLECAASFFQLVRANASESGATFSLTGAQIVTGCVAVRIDTDAPGLATDYARRALRQVEGDEPPHGAAVFRDRARKSLAALPSGTTATVIVGPWRQVVSIAPIAETRPLDSMLAIRATPIRIGGKKPAVRFTSDMEDGEFTLDCNPSQARSLGPMLYEEVDIVAQVARAPDGRITGGKLDSFEEVEGSDPLEAWREWGRKTLAAGPEH